MQFRVELDDFRGPLDLLLYLVRKHEIDVVELPLAAVTEQFIAAVELLERLEIDRIGEFIELAGILLELKSREVLPHADEVEAPIEDPRQDLVRQLLEYKRYRDAAGMLEDRFRTWQDHFARLGTDRTPADDDPADEPIRELELWDLVSAFSRVMREHEGVAQTSVRFDEVPIRTHMERIAERLNDAGCVELGSMFEPGMPKTQLVGLFLAVLELVRHYEVRTEQGVLFGEIRIFPGCDGRVTIDAVRVEEYDHRRVSSREPSAVESATAVVVEPQRVDAPQSAAPAPHEAPAKKKSRSRRPR